MTPVVAFGTKARPSGIRAQEAPDRGPRRVEQAGQVMAQEPDRLGLEPVAQLALDGQDRLGAGAVRAVVEERDGRVEPPARSVLTPG